MPLMTMAWGLYKKFGFEQEGVMRDYAFRDGQYVDAIMMSRINKNRG
ncbi:putative acetyltransferase YhhY [Providencia stuartii]|nr:putative acetyltransferase YhhY [Providencia stuartii]